MFENPFDSGKLTKMIIQAYASVDDSGIMVLSEEEKHKYTVQVNPESYTLHHNIKYNYLPGHGNSGSEAKHACSSPQTLNFEFLFDGTGVIPASAGPLDGVPIAGAVADLLSGGGEEDDVETKIQKFIAVVDYDGKEHEPHKLNLAWGKLSFDCVLTKLSLEYKLFNPDGSPLRAIAKASFSEAITEKCREVKEKNSSPDLTHLRTVSAGDKLPLMSHRIYRTANYYLEVARANNIYNFRNIKAGIQLSFPPIDKKAK